MNTLPHVFQKLVSKVHILSNEIPDSHPRKQSLATRQKLENAFKLGLVANAGLIAHGRGEAFDYLLSEMTHDFASEAIDAACSMLLLANYPVISCNGNVAALVAEEIAYLADLIDAKIEVNLFYKTDERVQKIKDYLEQNGAKDVLGLDADQKISDLDSERAYVSKDGIYKADVVLVPLEDGDRTEALKNLGKKIITVDLNPLSRTAQCADITIVDNIVRCIPLMIKKTMELKNIPKNKLQAIEKSYDNKSILDRAIQKIRGSYGSI